MTVDWAVEMAGDSGDIPLWGVAEEIVHRFGEGATHPEELPELAALVHDLANDAPADVIDGQLRALSHAGYLRGALVAMASSLHDRPRGAIALLVSRELMDALALDLGVRLCRAALALPDVDQGRTAIGGPFTTGNLLLGESLLEVGDAAGALRHFEAVHAVDVDHPRGRSGFSDAVAALERQGIAPEHRSRGLALLDGLQDLELAHALGGDRYELSRPLGRGRHAVVYEAYDRRVGRHVAIKRLLEPDARRSAVPVRVLERRFFTEAATLARVRSPYVVALLDAQPRQRFIAMDLCRGGTLRLALRRGLVNQDDVPRIGKELGAALRAVHAAGAVHRDVKPANILVRRRGRGSPIALADFGLAIGTDPDKVGPNAGTLRYLAPELRAAGPRATPASDWFSAGVVLLELSCAPAPLPQIFDRLDATLDVRDLVPGGLPEAWRDRLRRLLSPDPQGRTW